jgi:hypothetical protein
MAITTTGIAAELISLYQNDTQTAKSFMTQLQVMNETAAFFGSNGRLERTEKRYVDLVISRFTQKVQRFQKGFTPDGSLAFDGEAHPLHHVKINGEFAPDDFTEVYNSFLEGLDDADRKNWPFSRWYVEEAAKAANSFKELNLDYKGALATITPGTAQYGATTGFGQQINDWVTAEDITPITLAPSATPEDFVDQLVTFIKTVKASSTEANELYLSGAFDYLMLSPELHERFIEGMSKKYNTQYARITDSLLTTDASQIEMNIPGTSIKTKSLKSMSGSNKIILSPAFNRFGKVKSELRGTRPLAGVKDGGYEVWFAMDYWTRIGFYFPQYVWTNNQDLSF